MLIDMKAPTQTHSSPCGECLGSVPFNIKVKHLPITTAVSPRRWEFFDWMRRNDPRTAANYLIFIQ